MIMELSKEEVNELVIARLLKAFPRALPITIDYEPRSEKGFCHVNWVLGDKKDGVPTVP